MIRAERESERREGFAGRLAAVDLAELCAGGVRAARVTVALDARAAFVVGQAAARTAGVIVAVPSASW